MSWSPDSRKIRLAKYIAYTVYFDMGIWFYQYELKIKNFRNFIYNTYEKLWGHDINSLIWIFIRTGQEVFSEKKLKFQNVNLPYSHPIFIIFSLFCRKKCTLSFKIDSILEWISPLMCITPAKLILRQVQWSYNMR